MEVQKYAVYTIHQCPSAAVIALTANEVFKHIYKYDSIDYRMEPVMRTGHYDDDGNQLSNTQQTVGDGMLVFRSYFTDLLTKKFIGVGKLFFGATFAEAEENFLQEGFKKSVWDTEYWIVVPMEGYFDTLCENTFISRPLDMS